MTAKDSKSAKLLATNSSDGLSRATLDDGSLIIVKRRRTAAPGFFAAEARGLTLLGKAQCLRLPEVWAVDTHGIVLEDLGDGRPGTRQWQEAGVQLARQHAIHAEQLGLDHDGWCGDSPQSNTLASDGWCFFAEQRLLPQARRARDADLIPAADSAAVERLCTRLRNLIPEQAPSLLHGDLWTANLHACDNGELALIDAGAVHYGWAEADLAMLTLFGKSYLSSVRAALREV